MFHSLLTKIGIAIVGVLTALGIYQSPVIEKIIEKPVIVEEFGGTQLAVGGETYYLSGSGITATQTTIDLTKFGYTKPDGTYQKFNIGNFGSLGCGTFQPGTSNGKQEFISFTGITQNSDGTSQLTGVSRGLERFSPYSASTTLQTSHVGGSKFVISNSPPCFYQNYVTRNNTETILSEWGFTKAPTSTDQCNAAGELCDYTYVNSLSIAGAPTSTENALGIVRLGIGSEFAASTASSSSGAPLVLQSRYATSSPGTSSNWIPITESDGKFNQSLLDLSDTFTFTAASTTANRLLVQDQIQTGKLIATSTVRFNGQNLTFPSNKGASSTMLMNDGSGNLTWNAESWDFLGEFASTSATANLTAGNLPARKQLRVYLYSTGQASTDYIRMRFNGDTGANYGGRVWENFSDTFGVEADTSIRIAKNNNATSTSYTFDIDNLSAQRKYVKGWGASSEAAGSGIAYELRNVWNNTSAQITQIQFFGTAAANLNANSVIRIYGSRD